MTTTPWLVDNATRLSEFGSELAQWASEAFFGGIQITDEL